MNCLGLDIGGANLKAASLDGWARCVPFALWRNPGGLANALQELIEAAPAATHLAITMTGELCDCFQTKADGVRHILQAVDDAAAGRDVFVYLSDGRYVSITEAGKLPHLAAASNWRALAELVCRRVAQGASALLLDIGSTTTDIIPIVSGRVYAIGRNDTERLLHSELVYTGVGRTPICAVVKSLPYGDSMCPVAAELFSTTADAYLVLGRIDEDAAATWTADGRPLMLACARQRLARQICGDTSDLTDRETLRLAEHVWDMQKNEIAQAVEVICQRVKDAPVFCVASGSGEFLAREIAKEVLAESRLIGISEWLGRGVGICAPAFAIAEGWKCSDG